MHKSPAELHQQRGQLIERSAHQRATFARQAMPLKAACDATDTTLAAIRTVTREASSLVQRHPVAAMGLVAAAFALRPRGVMRWLGRTLFVWRSWRSLRGWLPRW